MIILNVDQFRDGGTYEIETDEGKYYWDNRIGTQTKGAIYDLYPNRKGANIVRLKSSKMTPLLDAIEAYRNKCREMDNGHT